MSTDVTQEAELAAEGHLEQVHYASCSGAPTTRQLGCNEQGTSTGGSKPARVPKRLAIHGKTPVARFIAWCTWLRMPARASASWVDDTSQPAAYCLSYFICAALHTALWILMHSVDLSFLSPERRLTVRIMVFTSAGVDIFQMVGLFLMGPVICRKHMRLFSCTTLGVLLTTWGFVVMSFMLSTEEHMPFQSRVLYLFTIVADVWLHLNSGLAGFFPWEARARQAPFWKLLWTCSLRTLRVADVCSDTMYVRLLYQIVQNGDCPWSGEPNCAAWRRLFAAVAACAGADWICTIILLMFGSVLTAAQSSLTLWLHIMCHVVGVICEAGIAAATVTSWIFAGVESTGTGGALDSGGATSTYLFFAASLACTIISFFISISSVKKVAGRIHTRIHTGMQVAPADSNASTKAHKRSQQQAGPRCHSDAASVELSHQSNALEAASTSRVGLCRRTRSTGSDGGGGDWCAQLPLANLHGHARPSAPGGKGATVSPFTKQQLTTAGPDAPLQAETSQDR